MNVNEIELNVLIKGRPITEFRHKGQIFIEGREGSEFELEVKNKTSSRVEAVLSVDGLSVMDGKEAGPSSSGYLIDAHKSIIIPGWKLNSSEVAKFEFSGKSQSYATQSTGSSKNNGVIGILVYKEQPSYRNFDWNRVNYPIHHPPLINDRLIYGPNITTGGILRSSGLNTDSYGTAIGAVSLGATLSSSNNSVHHITAQNSVSKIGTGFGEAARFETTSVSFNRGDLHAMIIMYYDNARGLRARGIDLRPSRKHVSSEPEAFPGMSTGCIPPKGWRR